LDLNFSFAVEPKKSSPRLNLKMRYKRRNTVWLIKLACGQANALLGYTKPEPIKNEYSHFTTSMRSLADRIRAAQTGPEILFILGEPQRLPSVMHKQQKN
jgi:hypothetical protein